MRTNFRSSSRALLGVALLLVVGAGPSGSASRAKWASNFPTDPAQLSSVGRNPYFILEPGHYRVLRGGPEEVVMTVLDETKLVQGVKTRVIEERETSGGQLTEISRNYFAIHKTTHDVLYFGEDVDIYKNGKVVSHDGTWLAGQRKARAGLIMPGKVRTGFRHYQEQAPGVALDRAEIVSTSAIVRTPAGTFRKCLRTAETSPMIRGVREYKYFAPGIGLVKYESLELVRHGFRDVSRPVKGKR